MNLNIYIEMGEMTAQDVGGTTHWQYVLKTDDPRGSVLQFIAHIRSFGHCIFAVVDRTGRFTESEVRIFNLLATARE